MRTQALIALEAFGVMRGSDAIQLDREMLSEYPPFGISFSTNRSKNITTTTRWEGTIPEAVVDAGGTVIDVHPAQLLRDYLSIDPAMTVGAVFLTQGRGRSVRTRITTDTGRNTIQEAFEAAGFGRILPHGLRKFAVTWLANKGVHQMTIARIGNWKSDAMFTYLTTDRRQMFDAWSQAAAAQEPPASGTWAKRSRS
jgi:integrase